MIDDEPGAYSAATRREHDASTTRDPATRSYTVVPDGVQDAPQSGADDAAWTSKPTGNPPIVSEVLCEVLSETVNESFRC